MTDTNFRPLIIHPAIPFPDYWAVPVRDISEGDLREPFSPEWQIPQDTIAVFRGSTKLEARQRAQVFVRGINREGA